MIVCGIHEKLRPIQIALRWGVAGWITENSELESEGSCRCASLRNNISYTYKGLRHNDFRYAVLSYLLRLSCTKGSHWCLTLLFIVLHGLLALSCMLLQQ